MFLPLNQRPRSNGVLGISSSKTQNFHGIAAIDAASLYESDDEARVARELANSKCTKLKDPTHELKLSDREVKINAKRGKSI